MPSLADLDPKALRDRRRMLKARIDRRARAIRRAQADREEATMLLWCVDTEIERRKKLRRDNG